MNYIYIQPIGKAPKELLDNLATGLEDVYGFPCRTIQPVGIPEGSFNVERGQYDAKGVST